MRFVGIPLALLTLILLVGVPVDGTPALQTGSSATYNFSVSISSASLYESCPMSGSMVACSTMVTVPPTFGINGTLGWTTTSLTAATAVLNVTSTRTTSSWDSTASGPRSSVSLNESIDLATRVSSIMPFLKPEIDQALQTAQDSMSTLPSGTELSSSMSIISSAMSQRHPVYTMWWVNGPLQLNQTVPVLVFPTNVTSATSVNLEHIGLRDAWNLTYILPGPSPDQAMFGTYSIPSGDSMLIALSFTYDQHSDLLLSATAHIHLGFLEYSPYQSQCTPSASIYCPSSMSTMPIDCGVDIQASLILANTTLNMDQPLSSTSGSRRTRSNLGSTGSSTGSGTGDGNGSGSPSSGSGGTSSGSDQRGYGPGGTNGGTGSGSGTGSSSGNSPQTMSTKPSVAKIPWIYWILGLVAVAIMVTGLRLARRRIGKARSKVTVAQPSN